MVYSWPVPDDERASRIAQATKMMLQECEGQSFEVRRRFGMLLPILRGHKMTIAGLIEKPEGTTGHCEICGQVVKVPREGTSVVGNAVENDCTAAEWRQR
jgi:hypothetical protein